MFGCEGEWECSRVWTLKWLKYDHKSSIRNSISTRNLSFKNSRCYFSTLFWNWETNEILSNLMLNEKKKKKKSWSMSLCFEHFGIVRLTKYNSSLVYLFNYYYFSLPFFLSQKKKKKSLAFFPSYSPYWIE